MSGTPDVVVFESHVSVPALKTAHGCACHSQQLSFSKSRIWDGVLLYCHHHHQLCQSCKGPIPWEFHMTSLCLMCCMHHTVTDINAVGHSKVTLCYKKGFSCAKKACLESPFYSSRIFRVLT